MDFFKGILMWFLAQMQWVATKYRTTAKCSYKYTLTISFLNINGSWNTHQILLQNFSILSLSIFLSFFTSSANTLLILRSSQDMAGFYECGLFVFFTEVTQGHCSHEHGMQCLLDYLGRKKSTLIMYSCKILQIKKFHIRLPDGKVNDSLLWGNWADPLKP